MSFKEINRKRDSLLRRWSTAGSEVESLYKLGNIALTDPNKLHLFLGRFNTLERFYSKFEAAIEELYDLNHDMNSLDPTTLKEGELLSEFPDQPQTKYNQNTRSFYMACQETYSKLNAKPKNPSTSASDSVANASTFEVTGASLLPKLNIPRYHGAHENWIQFKDIYESIVHNNSALTPTQKFHHLLGALQGDARAVIAGTPITDAGYATAWKSLNDTYHNKPLLAAVFVNKLINSPKLPAKPTPESLKIYLAGVSDTVTAFRSLKIPNESDFLLFMLASRNLPQGLREEFQLTLKKDEFPSPTNLANFVRNRLLAIQLSDPEANFPTKSEPNSGTPKSGGPPRGGKRDTSGGSSGRSSHPSLMTITETPPQPTQRTPTECIICSDHHGLYSCSKFNKMTPSQRYDALKRWSGCKICLAYTHDLKNCQSKNPRCRICKMQHNTMLCIAKSKTSQSKDNSQDSPTSQTPLGATLHSQPVENIAEPDSLTPDSQVILGTIKIDFFDARGQLTTIRAVLDSGSQFSYLTHRAVLRLGLTLIKTPRKISTLGGALFDSAQGIVRCDIDGHNKIPRLSTEFVVVKSITSALPTFPIPDRIRKRFTRFQLADDTFHKVSPVDALLGCDIFTELVVGGPQSIGKNLPRLLPTVYGDVVVGKLTDIPATAVQGTSLFSMDIQQDNLCFDLQKFWLSEEIPTPDPQLDTQYGEDDLSEKFFVETSYRLPDGKFGVRLPFRSRPVPDLTASKGIALRRFLNLESKFRKDPELKSAYSKFIDEYKQLSHMELAKGESLYVIPHHAVFNKGKIRVVFDGSAGGSNGSLNSHLLPGPPLQNDLRNILLEFRTFAVAFTTDAVKMFRMIEIHPDDRVYQRILWRDDESLPIQTYALKTVTYGLCSSPFHALRCLKELERENKEEFPLAAKALSRQVYVDDFICGSRDVKAALDLQRELVIVMKRGGFELAKWASNSTELLAAVSQTHEVKTVDFTQGDSSVTTKVLGLSWDVGEDAFRFSVEPRDDVSATKRKVLSTVSRIFDPIGLIAPITVAFKILIQQLWLANLGWDQALPDNLNNTWLRLIENLDALSHLRIPRRVTLNEPCTYQFIGFADASESAMCCTLYLRISYGDQVTVNLLTSKTKVAPIRAKLSIPKLELTAALMLARLYNSVGSLKDSLPDNFQQPVFFTDSMITLAWILKVPTSHLKIFVANRVTEIRNVIPSQFWRHIPGTLNPSDLGSRGVLPQQLVGNSLWFSGPPFLSQHHDAWPSSQVDEAVEIPEIRTKTLVAPFTLLSYNNTANLVDWMNRFSNYRTLLRVTARILRVIYNRHHKTEPRHGEFLLVELIRAFTACCQATQEYHFLLGNSSNFPKIQDQYRSLSPFLDEQGIIRVGGRLTNAPIDQSQRHPILLPSKAKFTLLLVQYYHVSYMHPSPSLLHALIQRRVWIPNARRIVRTVTRKCVRCFTARASAVIPRMGDLPHCRVTAARPFLNTGMDFAGPFHHKTSLLRKAVVSKMYFCVFVCMATKAVHLEPVTDLSTKAFLAAFARFTSRRGKPTQVFSDNGTNFVGASRELKELYQWLRSKQTQDEIIRHTSDQEISWSFIPPYSPNFGGLWEAAVRSVKTFLRSAVGDTALTFEQFATLLALTEAALNSRPMCPLSDSPSDFDYLSPGHFLIGAPLLATPERYILDQKINNLQHWQIIKRAYQEIWNRFYTEYLATLQKRVKWTQERPGLHVGDLVLVKTPNSPPLNWPTARVVEIHPGTDNRARVVTIRTSTATYKRSAGNLAPLSPINDSTREEDDLIPAD